MYKMKPQSPLHKQSPNTLSNSKRSVRTPLPSIHKENLLLGTNKILKNSQTDSNIACRIAPQQQKQMRIPQLIELKLTQPIRQPHQSKRKLLRPWAARPIDLNKQTLKADWLLIPCEKSKEMIHDRKGSPRESLGQSRELQSQNSEVRPSAQWNKTVRFGKSISTRERPQTTSRDKTGTCKIALKKSVFPMRAKQYEQQSIFQNIEREEDLLSSIQKEEDSDRFISIDSYAKLVF